MSMLKNPEFQTAVKLMAVLLVVMAVLATAVGLLLQHSVSQSIEEQNALMIAAVQRYAPEAVTPVIRQLTKGPDAPTLQMEEESWDAFFDCAREGFAAARQDTAVQQGKRILEEYSYTAHLASPLGVMARIYLMALICFVFFCAILFACMQRVFDRVRQVTWDIECAASGAQELNIRDNAEGEISYLKNEASKVTNALFVQAKKSQEDKLALKQAISDISHQIKTPITSLTVLCDVLLEQEVSDEQRQEFLENMQAQLDRIGWLVATLLKMSKLDAGTVEFEQKPVLGQSLAKRVMDPLMPLLEDRGVEFDLVCPEDAAFGGDLGWMAEALGNITKNCIEHTPAGGKVQMRMESNPMYFEIVVEDNGDGIDPADLPHLFERFYRGKNASKDSVGIGLALSRAVIERHGGVVDVESEQGKGTRFTIRLYKCVI